MYTRARIARRWSLLARRGSWECVDSMSDSNLLVSETTPPTQSQRCLRGDCGIYPSEASGLDGNC
jgi:hypothetical protein